MDMSPTQDCSICSGKQQLINKYEHLISLYRRKELKLSSDLTSHASNGLRSVLKSQSEENTTAHLATILEKIARKRLNEVFEKIKPIPVTKLAVVVITNKATKAALCWALSRIHRVASMRREETGQLEEETGKASLLTSEFQEIQPKEKVGDEDSFENPEDRTKSILRQIKQLTDQTRRSASSKTDNARDIAYLEISNQKLVAENLYLKRCLQESKRQQQKQNDKKRQSLHMLAEELVEKQELIVELEQSLKVYEDRYNANGDVLEDDHATLSKEVDRLESLRDRLNNEIDKLHDRQSIAEQKLAKSQQTNRKLEQEIRLLQENHLHYEDQRQQFKRINQKMERTLTSLMNKTKRLSVYERMREKQNDKQQISQIDSLKLADQIKSEIIFSYLANIDVEGHQINGRQWLDSEELEFLLKHKAEYLGLRQKLAQGRVQDKLRITHDFQNIKYPVNTDSNIIDFKKGAFELSNIFSLEQFSQKQSQSNLPDKVKQQQTELNSTKYIEKISELKQKLMHERVLILNLLRSLQLGENNFKNQALDALRVLADMFEYSEAEIGSIFTKKKKLFGLI